MPRKSSEVDKKGRMKKRNLGQEIKDAKPGDVIIWPCSVDENRCPMCGEELKSPQEERNKLSGTGNTLPNSMKIKIDDNECYPAYEKKIAGKNK